MDANLGSIAFIFGGHLGSKAIQTDIKFQNDWTAPKHILMCEYIKRSYGKLLQWPPVYMTGSVIMSIISTPSNNQELSVHHRADIWTKAYWQILKCFSNSQKQKHHFAMGRLQCEESQLIFSLVMENTDGIVQDWSIPSALAMEIMQSYIKQYLYISWETMIYLSCYNFSTWDDRGHRNPHTWVTDIHLPCTVNTMAVDVLAM